MEMSWLMSILLMGYLIFFLQNHHLIMMMISLEMIMLSLIYKMILMSSWSSLSFLFLPFISLIVCMGSYGISLVIMINRLSGKDSVLIN